MNPLEFIGVGDLHLDSGLQKYIPEFNQFVADEVRKTFDYARRNGVAVVVFYGDICHRAEMSQSAVEAVLGLVEDAQDLKLYFLKGNHDHSSDTQHALTWLKRLHFLPHVRVIDSPTTLFRKRGTPLRLLPWPHTDVDPEALNVLHIEVDGSVFDGGRAVASNFSTDALCVAGHLHTKQRVKNVYYSGTLYQTSFGEKEKKFFHHVSWDGENLAVQHIRATPRYRLRNLVVETEADLDLIDSDPTVLYKVFVAKDVSLDASTFASRPNVVRINSFRTKDELSSLMQQELQLDDESGAVTFSVESTLASWLKGAEGISKDLRSRALNTFRRISEAAS